MAVLSTYLVTEKIANNAGFFVWNHIDKALSKIVNHLERHWVTDDWQLGVIGLERSMVDGKKEKKP